MEALEALYNLHKTQLSTRYTSIIYNIKIIIIINIRYNKKFFSVNEPNIIG